MICNFCKEEVADGATKCKHCHSDISKESIVDLKTATVAINHLNVSERLKRRFMKMTNDDGNVSLLFNFWAFLGGFLYYIIVGLWRKGLVLITIPCAIMIALIAFDFPDVYIENFSKTSLLWALYAGFSANKDLYRYYVKREIFWW